MQEKTLVHMDEYGDLKDLATLKELIKALACGLFVMFLLLSYIAYKQQVMLKAMTPPTPGIDFSNVYGREVALINFPNGGSGVVVIPVGTTEAARREVGLQ